MRVKLIHGGDFSRFLGCGICEPGTIISIPEADALQLIDIGAVEPLPEPSAMPIKISLSVQEVSRGVV